VHAAEALAQLSVSQAKPEGKTDRGGRAESIAGDRPGDNPGSDGGSRPEVPTKPRRFYGSVQIDMVRPLETFDAILNAIVMELQRTPGVKVKLTLEVKAEVAEGFDDGDVGIVRDNAKQVKFTSESTGFDK
jgi:hypothetical protein